MVVSVMVLPVMVAVFHIMGGGIAIFIKVDHTTEVSEPPLAIRHGPLRPTTGCPKPSGVWWVFSSNKMTCQTHQKQENGSPTSSITYLNKYATLIFGEKKTLDMNTLFYSDGMLQKHLLKH